MWVDARVVVGPSAIEGRGLVAGEDLAAGTLVVRLGGRLVTSAEVADLIARADADPQAPYVDTVHVGGDTHLVLPPGTVAHFGNHSCEPSLRRSGAYDLVCGRAVAAGEELTVDYATLSGPGFAMDCSCGSPRCRGRVSTP